MFKRALSVFILAGIFSGLISVPAQAVSDRYIYCSTSGFISIKANIVAVKTPAEGGIPNNKCVGTAVVPDGVEGLGDYSMADEMGLTSIVIPDSVTAIGANALAGTRISRLIIPSSVVSISSGAFAYNPNMTSLIIPASVRTLSYFIGWQNTNLTKIYFLGKTAPTTHADAFAGIGAGPIAYVPAGSKGYNALDKVNDYSVDGETWKRLVVSASGAIVIYEGNGAGSGSAPDDANLYGVGDLVTVLANTAVAPKTSLSRTNHVFDGWTVEKDGGGTVLQPGDKFVAQAGANILYANWVGDPKVKYNGNGNSSGTAPFDANSPYAPGSSVPVLGNSMLLEKTGHTFDGWNTKADGTGTDYPLLSLLTVATSNVTLFAKWKAETHTVTYDGNGNTGGSVPVDVASPHNYNTSATVQGNSGYLTRTGYDFAGWNTLASGLGTDRTVTSMFTITSSDVVLYAKWTPKQISVVYSGNGSTSGSGMGPNSHSYDSLVTVRANENNLQRTGYDFAGWNTKADGTGTDRAVASTFTIGVDYVELFAKWNVKSYDFAYDGNGSTGGSLPAVTTSRAYNSLVYLLYSELTKTGYKFAGWNTKADGSGTQYGYPGAFYMPAENVTLYAQWSNLGSVTYSGNGNTSGTVPVDEGSPHTFGSGVIVLENSGDLVKSGYKFVGWNTEDDGTGTSYAATGLITFAMPELIDVTLFATWEPIPTGTVTYSGNGKSSGSVPVDAQSPHYYGSTVIVSTNSGALKKSGYKFIGWNTAADGSGTSYGSTGSATFEMPESDVTLFATWELIPVVKKPVVTKPVVTKPVVTKPVVTKPIVKTPVATKPVVKKAITLPRFPASTSVLSGEGLTALKNSVKNSGSTATYTVTGVAGKLPGVPLAYVKALAKVRAERLQAALMKLGVKKSNIKIKIEITEPKIIPRVKISVG